MHKNKGGKCSIHLLHNTRSGYFIYLFKMGYNQLNCLAKLIKRKKTIYYYTFTKKIWENKINRPVYYLFSKNANNNNHHHHTWKVKNKQKHT